MNEAGHTQVHTFNHFDKRCQAKKTLRREKGSRRRTQNSRSGVYRFASERSS